MNMNLSSRKLHTIAKDKKDIVANNATRWFVDDGALCDEPMAICLLPNNTPHGLQNIYHRGQYIITINLWHYGEIQISERYDIEPSGKIGNCTSRTDNIKGKLYYFYAATLIQEADISGGKMNGLSKNYYYNNDDSIKSISKCYYNDHDLIGPIHNYKGESDQIMSSYLNDGESEEYIIYNSDEYNQILNGLYSDILLNIPSTFNWSNVKYVHFALYKNGTSDETLWTRSAIYLNKAGEFGYINI